MDLTNLCEDLGAEFKTDPYIIWSEWNQYRLFESNKRMWKRKNAEYKMQYRIAGYDVDKGEGKRESMFANAKRDPETGRILPDVAKLTMLMS